MGAHLAAHPGDDLRLAEVIDHDRIVLGNVDGEPITTGHVSVYPKTSELGWCVYSFFVG